MKALTIWQPWASLIVAGAKPFEFRGWRPPRSLIGQRIVIHAAARPMKADEVRHIVDNLQFGGANAASTCLLAESALALLKPIYHFKKPVGLPLSAGLGMAIVGEPRNGFDIAEEFGLTFVNDSDRHEHANWGWPMLDIEVWPEPMAMRGAQGLWNWPTPESAGL
jgi:hypothetical protein